MSFSDYYKKWKEENNVTEEIEYNPNLTQAERNEFIEQSMNRRIEDVSNRIRQANANRTQTSNNSTNNNQSIWDKIGFVMNKFGTGVHQGTAGIAQGLLTDSANEMQKGKQKDNKELLNNFINAYAGNDLHHIAQSTLNTINEGINIINDKDKNLWQKMVDLNLNAISNGAKALAPMQGFYSSANQILGKATDTDQQLLEMNKNISEPLEERQKELANEGEKYDGATKFLGEAGQVIGNMIPSITASAITKNPSVALGVMGASVKGQATQEALDKGMSLDKATQIGDAKALIEVATEKLSGGTKVFGHGSLDDIAEELVKKGAKSKAGKFIMTQLLNAGGEIAEEEISNVLGNAIDKETTDPDKKVLDMKEAFETMGSTAFTTTMLNLLTGGMVNDYRQISNNMNQYKDANTGEILDNSSQNVLKQAENIINENNTPNLQQQSTQNEQILPTQKINQEQNNVVQNGNMEQNIANNQETLYNNIKTGETKNINTNQLLELISEGGYRTEEQINNLREDLKKNGITTPIEVYRKNDGTFAIENGNHRLKIAQELGIKDIPVKMVESWENIGINRDIEPNIKKEVDIDYDGSNGISETINNVNETSGDREGLLRNNNKQLEDRGTTERNVNFPTRESNSDEQTSSTGSKENNRNLKDSNQSSFNLSENEKKPSRHEVVQQNREIARENIKNISTWKDKKRGLSYQLETMERNMYDIIPDKEEAQRINDTYFNPIHESEAQKQRFINKYNDKIKEFNLNKYESEAVQLLGEQKYNPDFKAQEVQEILDKVNNNIEKGKIDVQKVNEAIETFRNIYDELFEIENKALMKNGYKEKPYRKGYFPHFIDYVPETKTEKILNKLGFKIDKRPLPTDIAGITEQFIPGKTWNKSSLERKGNKTDYNALKGFDTYISQASDNIFHTENIQRLRGLENEIRYQYSDKGIQERIDKIVNDETLYEDEKQNLIDQILEQTNNPMPNLVTELRRYTNALANKKSEADRSIENMMGRSVYSTVNAIENRFGANAVGLNMGSAFTNIIPITQAWSQVSTKNMGRAVIDTVKSYLNNDGFVDNSAFLTSRINQSEKLYKTSIEKISDKTSFLFNAIDEVTSNIVVRSKYLDNIQKGMSESEAIKNADQFARNVMADRSKGAIPTKFEEKNPITKAFTQFQLEVNNQYRYMFKDLPRDLKEKGLGSIALAFFKMFVGAWLYNEASEKITGRRPAFDPIDIAVSAYEDITDNKKGTYDKIASIGKNVAEELPFVGGLVGGGRIPVNGAIPDVGNITKASVGLATGEMDSKKAMSNIGKEVAKPLYYLLPPFGGAQIKKSVEGISTVANGGSYGVDSKGRETLQFPVENANALDYVKAGVFGKYALPLAKEYTENNYKSLNANQTKTYKESKIPYKEYLDYLNQDLKKNEDKIDYINKQNWGENQKWGIYINELFSDEERKEGGSQLEDAKYAIKNGISKTQYMKLYNETNNRDMKLPTQKEHEDLKERGITLTNYVDYQTKVHDETKKRKENGTLDENKQLKNKDKIEILLNSNYSDNEKEAIYRKSINSQDEKVEYLVDKLGFPIQQYLKYRQQDFENDKNEYGETIKDSKKNKVLNYLNSIPDRQLPQEYKKIICQMENNSKYAGDVAKFINNNTKLTSDEKKNLLKKMNFEVDRYGNIKNKIMLPISQNIK